MGNKRELFCLYGGSFDPPHQGHCLVLQQLQEKIPDARLVLLPAHRSPFKHSSTPVHHRLAMLKLAQQQFPKVQIDTQELTRPPPSYTIDTLVNYRHHYPQAAIAWVMGEDTLPTFAQWKNSEDFSKIAHRIILRRNTPRNHNNDSHQPILNVQPPTDYAHSHATTTQPDDLYGRTYGHIVYLENPLLDCASSTLRILLSQQPVQAEPLLQPEVYRYILHHHLYAT